MLGCHPFGFRLHHFIISSVCSSVNTFILFHCLSAHSTGPLFLINFPFLPSFSSSSSSKFDFHFHNSLSLSALFCAIHPYTCVCFKWDGSFCVKITFALPAVAAHSSCSLVLSAQSGSFSPSSSSSLSSFSSLQSFTRPLTLLFSL